MNERNMEGRGPFKPRRDLGPMVRRLIDNAPQYEPRANVGDTLRINEVVHVKTDDGSGRPSVLHCKWQEEGHVDKLTREECEALARAGYRINRDNDGYWCWWREHKLTHLWLTVAVNGWMSSRAPHPKEAQWRLVGSFVNPMVPYFEDYPVTPQAIVREGLTVALMKIQPEVPDNLYTEKFYAIAKRLSDEAVQQLEQDYEWFDDILKQVPLVDTRQFRKVDPDTDYQAG